MHHSKQSHALGSFPQIALAIRVLTSSIGVRVRRLFLDLFWGGLSDSVPSEGPSEGSSDVRWWCVWVSVR